MLGPGRGQNSEPSQRGAGPEEFSLTLVKAAFSSEAPAGWESCPPASSSVSELLRGSTHFDGVGRNLWGPEGLCGKGVLERDLEVGPALSKGQGKPRLSGKFSEQHQSAAVAGPACSLGSCSRRNNRGHAVILRAHMEHQVRGLLTRACPLPWPRGAAPRASDPVGTAPCMR